MSCLGNFLLAVLALAPARLAFADTAVQTIKAPKPLVSPSASAPSAIPHAEFAFRDSAEYSKRLIAVQGPRANSDFRFDGQCDEKYPCECFLYRGAADSTPVRAENVRVSSEFNSVYCTIPDSVEPGTISHVQVRNTNHNPLTVVQEVLSKLTFETLFHRLKKEKVRKIFRYYAERTFFEGEGVAPNKVECKPSQHLGVLRAGFTFILYKGTTAGDETLPGKSAKFPGDICQRTDFDRIKILGAPELIFGLYGEQDDGLFRTAIQATRAPEGEKLMGTVGWGSLPDANGECLPGLRKAWAWVAAPKSVREGGIDGKNPPSSFVDTNGSLNDVTLSVETPPPFLLYRRPNTTPCDASGNCTAAAFGTETVQQKVVHSPKLPNLCVIPKEMLD